MMAQGDGSSRPGDVGAAPSAAALRAQYRAARARLRGAPPAAKSLPYATVLALRLARREARTHRPLWLDDLIAFNEELRRLFLGGATTASMLSGERIRAIVAAHYRITTAQIAGIQTARRLAWPRQVAMYICARHAGLPTPLIGRLLGNRDQSTVRFAVAMVEERIEEDPALAAEIDGLVAKCRAGGSA